MTQITNTPSATALTYALPSAARSSFGSGAAFADAVAHTAQCNPPSAYIARPGPYSVETHGSHIVNGVQLIPGAPGYRPDFAASYMQEIAATEDWLSARYEQVHGSATTVQCEAKAASEPEAINASGEMRQVLADPGEVLGRADEEAENGDANWAAEEVTEADRHYSSESAEEPLMTSASFPSQRADFAAVSMLMDVADEECDQA